MQKQILKLLFLSVFFLMPLFVSADVNTIIPDPANVTACGTLNQAGATYVLQNDVSSEGSCFAIVASGITLDLNGHTVTYDNGTPINIMNGSFEDELAGSWDTVNAQNFLRSAGTYVSPVSVYAGSYALKAITPTPDQVVTSLGTVTLAPNTRYSLSGMVYNRVSDNILMSIEFTDTMKAIQTGITDRGFQYITYEFVTGDSEETYNIALKVTGAAAVGTGAVYFDDIKIQRNRLAGVMVGPVEWRVAWQSRGFDIKNYGGANNTTVKDGSIIQGSGKSDWSHALASESNSVSGHTFSGLNITTNGANSSAILMDSLQNGEIKYNTLAANMPAIKSRDQLDGAVLRADGYNSFIHDNVITNGVQGGILAGTAVGQLPQEIYNNNITLQGRYTNGFAISGNKSIIRNNTINCGSGNNSCRGIFIGSESEVFDNIVEVQDIPRNQEYNGCQGYGTYGIQMESAENSDVYGNVVTANSPNECPATAFRANPQDGSIASINNLIHHNTFIAYASGSARATSLKLSGCDNSMISIYSNTFRTNRRWIYAEFDGMVDGLRLVNNRWETFGSIDEPFYPFENFVWDGSFVKDMVFENNVYGAGGKERFESEFFRKTTVWPEIETLSNFSVIFSDVTAPASPTGLGVM